MKGEKMKYETYIKNVSRYILTGAEYIKETAERRNAAEKNMYDGNFMTVITNIVFSMGDGRFYSDTASRIAQYAEFLNATKAFVEHQPRGMNAFQIGEKWIESREGKK